MESAPENVEGVLTQSQLEEFPDRDRPVLLAVSKLEQLMRWHISQVAQAINQARRSEAELIQKAQTVKRICLWTVTTVIGALIVAVVQHFVK